MIKSLIILATALFMVSCQGDSEKPDPGSNQSSSANGTEVIIETSKGSVRVQLHDEIAPVTVANFLEHVDKKFYDGTIFHRVISNFMIQGGGFELKNKLAKEKATGSGIQNESPKTRSNTRGTLAMARTPDPDSATSQFFINVSDNDGTGPVTDLDYPKSNGHGYAVFGEVTEGMEVVDQIKEVEVHTTSALSLDENKRYVVSEFENVPVEPVVIESIRRASETP
jgi:cyclophilin family peptidyl-prolyl cis-trans isomerase